MVSLDSSIAFEVCREEALQAAAREIRKRELAWESLPGLGDLFDISEREISSPELHGGEKVNFLPPFRKAAKAWLPDYNLDAKKYVLSKPLSSEIEIRLILDRLSRGGSGKKFQARLGVCRPAERKGLLQMPGDFFALLGRDNLAWAYGNRNQLDAILEAAFEFLVAPLRIFEEACRKLLVPLPSLIPDDIPRRGPISAATGLEEARAMAHSRVGGADLPLHRILAGRFFSILKPDIDLEGRLSPHSAWRYQFVRLMQREIAWVTVPAIGSSSISFSGMPSSFAIEQPLPSAWIDSCVALPIAEEARKRVHRAGVELELVRILPTLESNRPVFPVGGVEAPIGPHWKIQYIPNHLVPDRAPMVIVVIDASSGKHINTQVGY